MRARYERWLARQTASGRGFRAEQRWWPDQIAEHIGVNVSIAPDDFDYGEFFKRGRRFAAMRILGNQWIALLDELNGELAV